MHGTIPTPSSHPAQQVLLDRTPAFLDSLETLPLRAKNRIYLAATTDPRASCGDDIWPLLVLHWVLELGWASVSYTTRKLNVTADELQKGLMAIDYNDFRRQPLA